MTIDALKNQEVNTPEKRAMSVQNEIQKEVLKNSVNVDFQKQLLQMLATSQPQQHIKETVQNQLSKGFLDIKV